MKLSKLIHSIILVCTTGLLLANPNYVVSEAQKGDGVLSLLKRYQIAQYECNIDEFYRLNALSQNQGLVQGKSYYLPIQTHEFNSKSIRTTLGINDFDLALSIQHYNENALASGLRPQDFRQDKILWVPFHFLNCNNSTVVETPNIETVPMADMPMTGSSSTSSFEIFGEKYKQVPNISSKLKGEVFYIVAGHGGPDPGAVYKQQSNSLCEDEYAYDVSLRLARNLIAHGATAYVIVRDNNDGIRDDSYLPHDTDEVVWGNKAIPLNQKARLKQRTDVINSLYKKNKAAGVTKQSAIFVHVDSRKNKKQIDLFFYYRKDDKKSKSLAQKLHKKVKHKYSVHRANGNYNGTISSRDLYVLRETKIPAVYIELGNISNPLDQQRILPSKNRQALANWFCEGLMD